jgi:hypothetical protein
VTGDLAVRRTLQAGGLAIADTNFHARAMELMLETCAEVCRLCADECVRHARRYKHCLRCARECRCCARACLNAARVLKAIGA